MASFNDIIKKNEINKINKINKLSCTSILDFIMHQELATIC